MGACFQAPRATPGQRPMETLLCLTFVSFHHYSHCHMSFHLHKTTSTLPERAGILHGWAVWSPLQYLPKVKERKKEKTIIIIIIIIINSGSGNE